MFFLQFSWKFHVHNPIKGSAEKSDAALTCDVARKHL